jgi:DNA helicase-2/ATP-dependent DNA helicase PcrA
MRERVEELVGTGINMWILTFHSACLRILRTYGDRIGYDKDFVVYDPTDQKVVIKNSIKAQNIDEKKFPVNYVLSIISDCKEKAISPAKYLEQNGENIKTKTIYNLYKAYEGTLKKNNAMDFDDLILRTVQLFEKNEDILAIYQDRFKYIMVDEYQDTNYMQYRFIKLLAEGHNNICVVGDDDQCIYQWRGADIKNILEFEKDFKNTKVIKLEDIISIEDISDESKVSKVLLFMKIKADFENRVDIIVVANACNARVIEMTPDYMILEALETETRIGEIIEIFKPYGILELVKTGVMAMKR